MNSAAMMGAPSSAMVNAVRNACARGGRPTGMWALTSAVSMPSSASSMAAAVSSDCELKKLLIMVKKPRKKMTSASRRARNSRVFRAKRAITSVTPASRPTNVPCEKTVPATARGASRPELIQRLGRGRLCQASHPRHTSTPAASSVVHTGRVGTCGAITQAITTSKNSVSRASRGNWARVWRSEAALLVLERLLIRSPHKWRGPWRQAVWRY